eukprot:Skav218210  [mRNA]  locus=scaffold1375:4041:11073:- [translate_table: standard]
MTVAGAYSISLPGKFCYEYQPETSKSEMAMKVAKEVEEAQEEERKIARRNSLQRIKGDGGGLSPLLQEPRKALDGAKSDAEREMFQRFAACQARRPVTTCLVTGASVMSIGDSAVQLCGSGTLDLERNVVVSAYNGGTSPFFYFWWQTLDGLWPGKGVAAVARKALLNQATMAPFNSALFLTWSTALEQRGLGGGSWIKSSRFDGDDPTILKCLVQYLGEGRLKGEPRWLRFMPQHLRVVFMSSCAVVWGGYISYVVHR